MATIESPQLVFEPSPLFSVSWLGRHPGDHTPRMVQCFGPATPDGTAALRASALGLEPIQLGNPPLPTPVSGHLHDQHLTLHCQEREFLRTERLSFPLLAALQWRPEVLLVWVDVPLRDARSELPLIGLQHVWTGIATVRGHAW